MIANFLAIWIIMIYINRVNFIYVVTDGANGAEKVDVHFIHVWLVENVPESAVESGRQVEVHSKKVDVHFFGRKGQAIFSSSITVIRSSLSYSIILKVMDSRGSVRFTVGDLIKLLCVVEKDEFRLVREIAFRISPRWRLKAHSITIKLILPES